MTTFLALLLTIATAPNRTGWMRLESFHLTIGMPRTAAVDALKAWDPKRGKTDDEVVVDYDGDKAITLEFHNERLRSARLIVRSAATASQPTVASNGFLSRRRTVCERLAIARSRPLRTSR